MAKNELVSLALIHRKPLHAYGINIVLKEVDINRWGKVSQASVYNALARLEKEKSVEVKKESGGNMPDRKVYAITTLGKARLKRELQDAILSVESCDFIFYIAVTFCFGLESKIIIELFKKRIELLEKENIISQERIKQLKEYKINNALIMYNAGIKHIEIEIEMIDELVNMIKDEPDYYGRFAEMLTTISELKKG